MPRQQKMDAIALLKADHRKVEDLFAKFEKAREKERKQALVKEICIELCIHTMIEEEIFYPACADKAEGDTVEEAYVEHDGAKVLVAEGAAYEHQLAEPLSALIVSLAGSYDALVAPATTSGKNVMPRVAALLDVMQVSDIVHVVAPDTFDRLIYAGNAVQTVRAKDSIKVITVRTAAFQAPRSSGSTQLSSTFSLRSRCLN